MATDFEGYLKEKNIRNPRYSRQGWCLEFIPLFLIIDAPGSVFSQLWERTAPKYLRRAQAAHDLLQNLPSASSSPTGCLSRGASQGDAEMFCARCGRQLRENQKFSTNCGSSVELVASPNATPYATQPAAPPIKLGRPPSFRFDHNASSRKANSPLLMRGGIGALAVRATVSV